MEKKDLNIYQKLAKIRKQVEVLKKDKEGFNYTYVGEDKILANITGLMNQYGLSLIPGIVHGTMTHEACTYTKRKVDKATKTTYNEVVNEIIVRADMVFKWVNNNDPSEYIEVPWGMIGQQSDSSQAFGSGLSYSNRYFLLKYFNVATVNDDPDNWRSRQKAAEIAADKELAHGIIEAFDTTVKEFVNNHPDKLEDAKKLVSKYVSDGDYFKISEPVLASKLTSEFNKKFLEKEGK